MLLDERSYWIREAKISALNVGDDQDSMLTFGGGDLALTCAGDRGLQVSSFFTFFYYFFFKKIALLFVQVTGHLVRHLNRCSTQPGHMYILVFIALKQI